MSKVNLKDRPIKATCAYCGSDDVGVDRQPYWDVDANEWRLKQAMPAENYLMRFKGKQTSSPYNRACQGDTDIILS